MTSESRNSLRAALYPTSIALIGASDNPNKIGGRPLAFLARFGYAGKVYPINPLRPEVQGFQEVGLPGAVCAGDEDEAWLE